MSFDWDVVPTTLSEQIAQRYVPRRREMDGELLALEEPDHAPTRGRALLDEDALLPAGKLRIAPEVEERRATRKSSRRELDVDRESEDDDSSDSSVDSSVDSSDRDHGQDDEQALSAGGLEEDEEQLREASDDGEHVDTSGIMEAMAAAQRAEMAKAKAVEKQVWLFKQALGARIRLQAALTAANRVPVSAQPAPAASAVRDELQETLRVLAAAHGSNEAPPPTHAPLDQWWQWVHRMANEPRVAQDETIIEEWNRRTEAASGAAGGRVFKALGRPVMEQVRYALRNDMARLVKRSQMNRARVVPLDAPAGAEPPQSLENIYDDGDFYGQLLKSFIEASAESAASSAPVLRVRTNRHMTREEKKRRKTQSMMGVQQELLNFMAPLTSAQLPPMADALFGSLFG